MDTPLLINEKLVSFFKFWAHGEIQEGMRCGKEFFQYCQSFDRSQRQEAYTIACSLAATGAAVVITTSGSNYKIWRSLRAKESSLSHAEQTSEPSSPLTLLEKA